MSELIDRNALLSKRGELAYCEVCPVWSLIKDAPAASPWHRVEDGLPEPGTNCIIGWKLVDGFCYEDSVYGYGANGIGFWVRREEHDQVVDPDYWMPIEPPKEEKHGN